MSILTKDWPKWLQKARTEDANVKIEDGVVLWRGGVWHGGVWCGGVWCGGEWRGGVWCGGEWRGGVWRGGMWRGGEWRGGEWHDKTIDRLIWMAATCGIIFDVDGYAVAYRTTDVNGNGRHMRNFQQTFGRVDVEYKLAGAGTCVPGLHVSSPITAWTYFGIDSTARLWRVRFHRDDLLDCDGEKARLRGGWCEEIPVFWLVKEPVKAE